MIYKNATSKITISKCNASIPGKIIKKEKKERYILFAISFPDKNPVNKKGIPNFNQYEYFEFYDFAYLATHTKELNNFKTSYYGYLLELDFDPSPNQLYACVNLSTSGTPINTNTLSIHAHLELFFILYHFFDINPFHLLSQPFFKKLDLSTKNDELYHTKEHHFFNSKKGNRFIFSLSHDTDFGRHLSAIGDFFGFLYEGYRSVRTGNTRNTVNKIMNIFETLEDNEEIDKIIETYGITKHYLQKVLENVYMFDDIIVFVRNQYEINQQNINSKIKSNNNRTLKKKIN